MWFRRPRNHGIRANFSRRKILQIPCALRMHRWRMRFRDQTAIYDWAWEKKKKKKKKKGKKTEPKFKPRPHCLSKNTCGQHAAATNDLVQLSLLIDRFRLLVRLRQDWTTRYKDGTCFILNIGSTKYDPTAGCKKQNTHKKYVQDMTKILRWKMCNVM